MQHKITGQQVDVALADLNDTLIASPANTQVLTYNGTKWVNAAASGGAAGNVTPHAEALHGMGTISGTKSNSSLAFVIGDPEGQTGVFNYLPFTAGAGVTVIGIGDDDSPGTPAGGEPISISSINDPYNFMNGATQLVTPANHRGSAWQITLELTLDPTYIGFVQNFPDNSASHKNIAVSFQFWNPLFPSSDALFTTTRPAFEMSTSCYVMQKNANVNPYGTDLSGYFPRFVASAEVWLPPGTSTITWSSADVPFDTPTVDSDHIGIAANGQPFTKVAGSRLSMHRIYEGETFIPPVYYLSKDTAYVASIPTNQVQLSPADISDSTPIWVKFTVASSGTYQMDTAGSGTDTVIGLFGSTGNLIATDDDTLAPQSRITHALTPGDYYCVLGDYQTNFSPAFGVSEGTGGGLIKFSIIQL